MNNKTKGALAGVAGLALFAGGTTFALWQDSAAVDGGNITSGDLDVALIGTAAWQDISADRTDSPHAIDLTTYRIIPGDTIQGRFEVDVALLGDNMRATLDVTSGGVGALLATPGVSVTYTVLDGAGVAVTGAQDIALGTASTLQLRSAQNTLLADNARLAMPSTLDGTTEDFTVVLKAVFDSTTANRDLTNVAADLSNVSVTLTQVRT